MTDDTPSPSEDAALALQDRFVRGFPWLRRVAGMTQGSVADAAGWQQPYVARLEDAKSPLLGGLSRLERYADACGFSTVLVFVDKDSGAVARTLNLGEAGAQAATRLLPAADEVPVFGLPKLPQASARWVAAQAAAQKRFERS